MTERTNTKVKLDQTTLTFAELADIEESLGGSLSALFERAQARGMAALVWVTVKRERPDFTFDEAMQYGPADIEMTSADPEAPGDNSGDAPLTSPASGDSTPST